MDRTRYQELTKIADDVCLLLEKAQVKQEEGCVIRRIAEAQWDNTQKWQECVPVPIQPTQSLSSGNCCETGTT